MGGIHFTGNLSSWYSYLKITVNEIQKNPEAVKILTLRALLISCLFAAAIATTLVSYQKLEHNEHQLFVSQFETSSQNALNAVVDSFDRMNMGIQEFASTYSHMFPDEKTWPYVAWTGFQPTAKLLGKVSAVETVTTIPIVKPEEIETYQNYVANYYSNIEPYFDPTLASPPFFPPGSVWRFNRTTLDWTFHIDKYGNSTKSRYQMLTPLIQYTLSALAREYQVGLNIHADILYTETMDTMMDCVYANIDNYEYASTNCGTIAPAVSVPYSRRERPNPIIEDMIAGIVQPIFPANNQTILVGFIAGSISWKALLTHVFPHTISGIYCVISSDSSSFTFYIDQGVPILKGLGDLHNTKYSKYGQSSPLLHPSVKVTKSSTFTLTFYPTKEFADDYQTDLPLIGALVLLFIFLFCSALFATYDVLMQRKFGRNQAVLDTKRRFVRFISHEIRTPLNIIALGMKLLEVELGGMVTKIDHMNAGETPVMLKQSLRSWKHLAKEIVESSESAVEVLNDLLNYDKIEVGTLKLEYTYFNVRDLVQRTVSMLQVQAQLKDINIQLLQGNPLERAGESPHEDLPLEDCMVVGDVARMGQVLRNLISNALKFTPSAGAVTVTGKFCCVYVSYLSYMI